ncbi:secretin and TonB N-terminal domain-containing protein [Luteimonas sp. SJ-92]|uniref:Secretin and TonB N-terminal domain-containing protein n=1 Tax=Luteimonas salinisoli TaxID=2752307 RepID=A0A853JGM4_9GAMM|nr:STN domain-containing protein [Luteimonas salinisoli]NZA27717.1 secretin and TonB N-terminal domain-containing protein [Luteimonas salinisoli]
MLALLAATACVQADVARKRFEIARQPAAAGLNEFARQADITLIFSYDLVAGAQTRALKGEYSVGEGLRRLLVGTALDYQQLDDDIFSICRMPSCGPSSPAQVNDWAEQRSESDTEWRKTSSAPSQ